MATPTSRNTFKEYCLRTLGKPVVDINVDDQQVEDRIDDALQYYRDYHFDGTERIIKKIEITQSIKDNKQIATYEWLNNVHDSSSRKDTSSENITYDDEGNRVS